VQEKEEEKDQGNEFCLSHSFLHNDDNKKELFAYLGTATIQNPLPDKIIVTTHKQNVLSSSPINSSNLETTRKLTQEFLYMSLM